MQEEQTCCCICENGTRSCCVCIWDWLDVTIGTCSDNGTVCGPWPAEPAARFTMALAENAWGLDWAIGNRIRFTTGCLICPILWGKDDCTVGVTCECILPPAMVRKTKGLWNNMPLCDSKVRKKYFQWKGYRKGKKVSQVDYIWTGLH